jgi:hypothetical protein
VFRKSDLEKALTSWLTDGGSLQDKVPHDGARVTSESEAKLVCVALDKALSEPHIERYSPASYNLGTAIGLFQSVNSERAASLLRAQGLPRLRMLIRTYFQRRHIDSDTIVFVAKILARYGEPDDVALVLQLARDPECEDRYLWSTIFSVFESHDANAVRVIDGLRNPLPKKYCRIAFLDFCNQAAIRGALSKHPFDTLEGRSLLREWLSSSDKSESSYAISATAALPFIDKDVSSELAAVAAAHPDATVRMESAWAQAKMGRLSGLEQLTELAKNPVFAHRAIRYLEELGHAERVPEEARTPDAMALAEIAQWLAHPNELGEPPEDVSIADTRELYWPPTNDRRRLWVIRYTHRADGELAEGFGLVGSTTWAMFGESPDQDPMDVYAIHCCWELQGNDDPRAPSERSAAAGRRILAERNPEFRLRGA